MPKIYMKLQCRSCMLNTPDIFQTNFPLPPFRDQERLVFYDSGFPIEAQVINIISYLLVSFLYHTDTSEVQPRLNFVSCEDSPLVPLEIKCNFT